MATLIISFFIIVLSFNFFTISFQINGINRLVLGAPMSLFETSIELFGLADDEKPWFNKQILESNIIDYFDYSMPNFTDDYDISFFYYNPANGSICWGNKCYAVEICVDATLMLSYPYSRTMFYEIRSE